MINLIIFTCSLPEYLKDKRTSKFYEKALKAREKLYRNLEEIVLSHDEEATNLPTYSASDLLDPEATIDPEDYPTHVVSNQTMPTIPKSVGNRDSELAIIKITNVEPRPTQSQLKFDTFVKVKSRNPPLVISFFIRLFYSFRRSLRNLDDNQNGYYKDTPVKCTLQGSQSTTNGVVPYDCTAETDGKAIQTAEINTELPMKEDGKELSSKNLTFSPEAAEASKNITYITEKLDRSADFIELNNGEVKPYPTNSKKFIVNGTIDNFKNKEGDIFSFRFPNDNPDYPTVETNCKVSKISGSYVEFECGPVDNLKTQSINLSPGKLGKTNIVFNMIEGKETIDISSGDSVNNGYYRKKSSGLSGGAIAGIIIACAVALIIASAVAVILKKSKPVNNPNPSFVGLNNTENNTDNY